MPEILHEFENKNNSLSKFSSSILLSHLHLDHSKALNLVPSDVPIYMSENSKQLLKNLKDANFNEILGKWRDYNGLEFNKTYEINGFNITFVEVDHDISGASGILIENNDLSLFYTGDVRLHGCENSKTKEAVEFLNKKDIDALIIEGVTISFVADDYEVVASDEVLKYETDFASDFINNYSKESELNYNNYRIIYFNTYLMAKDRIISLTELSKKTNYTLVLTKIKAEVNKEYLTNVNYLVLGENITLNEINNSNNNYLIDFDFFEREKYNEINCESLMIHCGGTPLGDYDPNYKIYENYCNEHKIKLAIFGLGGHATPSNLKWIANSVNSTYTFPLHSFKPQLLKPDNSTQILPIKDFEYIFEGKKLVSGTNV